MKPISPQLASLFKSRQFFQADLYQFNLQGGGVLRYCSGDKDVTWNAVTYPATGTWGSGSPGGPYFDRKDNKAKIHQASGTAVDTLVFDVIPGDALVFGEAFLSACHDGIFDNATMSLDTAFMPTWNDTTAGTVQRFFGRVGQVDAGRSVATFTVNSWLEFLNQPMPRNIYTPGCPFNLGDTTCGVNLNGFAVSGAVSAASTNSQIIANITNAIVGYYDTGKIVFTSGALNGQSRTVRSAAFGSPGVITLLGPFTVAPQVGDTYQIFPGCDKSLGANGCPKFNNNARYGGYPYIPQPVTAV